MKKYLIFFFFLQMVFSKNLPALYFTPNSKTDKILLSLIENAKSSVYIAGYSISSGKMIELIKKNKERIVIKVLTERDYKNLPKNIVKVYQKSGLFHPKFITVDGISVLIGSGNFTDDGLHLHHNHFLLIQDPKIAEFFNKKFLAWWQDTPFEEVYEDSIYRIYFSPDTDCESIIVNELSKARDTIHFAHYRFTSEKIARAIILKKFTGVKVYGIMDASGIEPYSFFYPLSYYGCKLKKSNLAGLLHDKLFIIDGETVITGSYNPTTSAKKNTECLIIIKDKKTAEKLLTEWKKLWLFYSLPASPFKLSIPLIERLRMKK
ncbi:MAG: phospholipase D-like domain-containing protein [bacterium]|nr:phospholipase D-like domain-containing protein [bacterium]